MKRRSTLLSIAAGIATLISSASAEEQAETRVFSDLIHSDLPLPSGAAEVWPQHFSDAETGDFGCASRITFGDWGLRYGAEDDDDDSDWYSFSNYGAFHCFALVRAAADREALQGAEAEPAFFVKLGISGGTELWALQVGTRPGSDYILLSRAQASGAISEFNVLQRRCPKNNIRDAGTIDTLITRYCAINSKSELLNLAKRMAKLESLGTLAFVEAPSDQ